MGDKIQIRRDTAANFTSEDPTLLLGEIAYETDTGKLKVGDAVTKWNSLGYVAGSGGGDMLIATYDPAGVSEQLVGLTAAQTLTNKTYSGFKWTEQLTAGENVVAGNWCYLKTSDQKMWKTDADAEATSIGFIAVATETINADATGTFHHQGRWTTSGLTAGSIYYLSGTGAAITTTKPSGNGDIVREVGQALSTTVLIVDVDISYVEVTV